MNTSHLTPCTTIMNLHIPNIILIKLLFCPYITISSQQYAINKYPASAFSTFHAAFDTIYHSILIHRLSFWFGSADSALTCFKTYLTSRSFSVLASGFPSPLYPLSCSIPQGFVLWPIRFNMYRTPLSTHLIPVIKSSSLCWWHPNIYFFCT